MPVVGFRLAQRDSASSGSHATVAGNRTSLASGIAVFVTTALERALGTERDAFSSEAQDGWLTM
jgi:hypothetical protein